MTTTMGNRHSGRTEKTTAVSISLEEAMLYTRITCRICGFIHTGASTDLSHCEIRSKITCSQYVLQRYRGKKLIDVLGTAVDCDCGIFLVMCILNAQRLCCHSELNYILDGIDALRKYTFRVQRRRLKPNNEEY